MKYCRSTVPVTLALALAVALLWSTLAPSTARAADPVTVDGQPGLLYNFGSFERRGVTLNEGGQLLVRIDGCWFAEMTGVSGNTFDNTIAVTIRVTTPRGHLLTTLPLLPPFDLPAGDTFVVDAEGCDPALAAAFPSLDLHGVSRVFSVR